jgi:uncharacterized membrane protein HdeD (DUF308 family)
MRLSERLRRLDDNVGSRSIVRISDQFGWWWHLGLGLVLVIVGTVLAIVGAERSNVIAAYVFGFAALFIGWLLAVGRRRRLRR